VPGDYYDRPLEWRQGCLAAASRDHNITLSTDVFHLNCRFCARAWGLLRPAAGVAPGLPGCCQQGPQHNSTLTIHVFLLNCRFVRVPGDYYDRLLEWRQGCLAAASTQHNSRLTI
jgi:hypothetical protein